jgi:hypothetical protein
MQDPYEVIKATVEKYGEIMKGKEVLAHIAIHDDGSGYLRCYKQGDLRVKIEGPSFHNYAQILGIYQLLLRHDQLNAEIEYTRRRLEELEKEKGMFDV